MNIFHSKTIRWPLQILSVTESRITLMTKLKAATIIKVAAPTLTTTRKQDPSNNKTAQHPNREDKYLDYLRAPQQAVLIAAGNHENNNSNCD